MPIRKPKPTSPGRRFVTYSDYAEITKKEPEKRLTEGLKKSGGRNAQRAQDRAPPRRRGQAPVPQDRLQAHEGRDPRQGRLDRVRPEPVRLHRADQLPRRREALHPRPEPPARRHDGAVGRRLGHRRGQRAAAGQHAGRHDRPQRRAAARPRRPARPLRRRRHPADGEGGRLRHPAPALGRDAHGARRVPRHRRHDRQRRPPERHDRQGRPQASHGRAPADARHGDEPGRPPARRRRGRHAAGQPSADAVGRADDRLPHPQEGQGVGPLHRPRPPPRQEGGR